MWLPFDLHPEIPDAGVELPERRRAGYEAMFRPLADAAELTFAAPVRVPRTREALEAAELVRQRHTGAFDSFHRALFAAHWAQGRDIGRREVLLDLASGAGVPRDELERALEHGTMRDAVEASTRRAIELGVTGTPAWLIDGRFLVPGAQEPETFDRLIERLRERGKLS